VISVETKRASVVAMTRAAVLVAAAVAFAVAHWRAGAWSVDDAGITYAYSVGLADHGSLSPLPESMPVEGYSNPLLFLIAALLRFLHLFDPITTHTRIELVAFALMALVVHELLRARVAALPAVLGTAAFVALELLTPATWVCYASGLENVLVSLALLTLVLVADRASRTGTFHPFVVGVLGFLAALVRPEAPVYVAALYLALLVTVRPIRIVRLVVAGSLSAGLYVAFLIWRHRTYGAWLPNTYFAKLEGGATPFANIAHYVIPSAFMYYGSVFFASSVAILGFVRSARRLAVIFGIMTLASLVMPVVGGAGGLLDHRFATPFFAMCHLGLGVCLAVLCGVPECIAAGARRSLLILAVLAVGAVAITRIVSEPPPLQPTTTSKVVELHGVRRMQHQRRLGLIDPVVIAPDAGGSLLFGSMQYIDSGYLTDFQMAHMTRALRFMTQYQSVEREADLADTNPSWSTFDRTQVGSTFLSPQGDHMFARRSLVELDAPPRVDAFYEGGGLRLYVSPENVLAAGPSGLVRIEVVVAWTDADATKGVTLSGTIEGDSDAINLTPYGDLAGKYSDSGLQRRALLLRAPSAAGVYDAVLELSRNGSSLGIRTAVKIEVLTPSRVQDAIDAIVGAPGATPDEIMKRFAWLREQYIPRLSQQKLREEQRDLVHADEENSFEAGPLVQNLIWDARLASLTDELPQEIRVAESKVVDGIVDDANCIRPGDSLAHRALCIGRTIDRLRRYGYFGVLARQPRLRAAQRAIDNNLTKLDRGQRYVALVGLTLAMPEDVREQNRLVRVRNLFATTSWPSLAP
jgi:hypothetical protein